jgi:hypothetical protein
MRKLLIIAVVATGLSACADDDFNFTELKRKECIEFDGKQLACVDDHIGKNGKEEVKADVIEVVEGI